MADAVNRERVAFLFLGETLLIPHLWPIVEALAACAPDLAIDLWVATSMHEALLGRWAEPLGSAPRIRHAPGFVTVADDAAGRNPPLPAKLPMLARLAPRLIGTKVAVCAEQTSLWIPTILPFHPTRFVKTAHGAGSMSERADRRRRAAARTLVPSRAEGDGLVAHGVDPATVTVTGYVKASFRQRTPIARLFADDRPILLYTPHWQRHRSSWWDWGRQVVAMLAAQDRWNVILAPHQRLIEKDADAARVLRAAAGPHVHVDLDSFATVDGSYTAAADLYLGDTSSQVVEFLARPRPCVFLDPQAIDWRAAPDRGFWTCGEVVQRVDRTMPAIDAAFALHPDFAPVQATFAARMLGDTSGGAPHRAAEAILAELRRR